MGDINAVLMKVRALRELAARAGTVHEAETAAAQADALLQKHRLTDADLSAAGAQPSEAIGEDEVPLWEGGKRLDGWVSRLSATLAKHYGCAVYSLRHRRGGVTESVTMRIAGLPSDVAIVRYMFAWLHVEIARLAASEPGPSRSAFKQGAVTGIRRALDASREASEREHAVTHGDSAAMVLASRFEAAETWLATAHGEMGKGRAPSAPIDRGAYLRGIEAGESIDVGGKALPGASRALPQGGA